jgi:transketolase
MSTSEDVLRAMPPPAGTWWRATAMISPTSNAPSPKRRRSAPSLIACRTIIGKGAPNKQGGHSVHGAPLGDAEIAAARAELGWTLPPSNCPPMFWPTGALGARGAAAAQGWADVWPPAARRRVQPPHGRRTARHGRGEATFNGWLEGNQKVATRKASELALEVLTAAVPEMVGGSADLTGSNLTKTKATTPLTPDDYAGRYVFTASANSAWPPR